MLKEKSFVKSMIWLDLEPLAKLYDKNTQNQESKDYQFHKIRYCMFKAFIEDAPLLAMQAVYLSFNLCD